MIMMHLFELVASTGYHENLVKHILLQKLFKDLKIMFFNLVSKLYTIILRSFQIKHALNRL